MAKLSAAVASANSALSYLLGATAIALAAISMTSALGPVEVAQSAVGLLGLDFVILIGLLTGATLFAWERFMHWRDDPQRRHFWLTLGRHTASGILTLALTYTLVGFMRGLWEMSAHEIKPETVPQLISALTDHLGMAMATTIIGLPLGTGLLALIAVTVAAQNRVSSLPEEGEPR